MKSKTCLTLKNVRSIKMPFHSCKDHVVSEGRYSFPTNQLSRKVEINFGGILRCLSYSERIQSALTVMDESYNGMSLSSI